MRAKAHCCTEKKPQCQRCCDGNRDCSYGLKLTWPDEAASRGIVIGRTGTRKKGVSAVQPKALPTRIKESPSNSERRLVTCNPPQSWTAFLNTTSEDISAHSNQAASGNSLLKRKEEESGTGSKAVFRRSSTLDVAPFSFSSIGRPSAGMRSQLNLSKSDSLLFDFCMSPAHLM